MAITTLSANSIGTGVISSSLPTGSVLQTVQDVKTDIQLIESTSFVDVLTKSITPSATSSKILIMAYVTVSGYGHYDIKVTRGDADFTDSRGDQVGSNRVRSAAHFYDVTNFNTSWSSNSPTIVLLDSPSTTSATTYKIKAASPNDAGSYDININDQHSDADALYSATTITSLTLQEIKG
tara:strand:- start:887 stop:1426 length:540 start_codon:yes stop_codon:yes gene_type:complete